MGSITNNLIFQECYPAGIGTWLIYKLVAGFHWARPSTSLDKALFSLLASNNIAYYSNYVKY